MQYNIKSDLKAIREIQGITQKELADQIGVEQATISRNERGETVPSKIFLEKVYAYAFKKDIQLNRLKEMFWREELQNKAILLFHGSKNQIFGELDINYGRSNNDFGSGFYVGNRYEQAVSFLSNFKDSSVYLLKFDNSNLTHKVYDVNQEWMMIIAYYRGTLDEYKEHPYVKQLLDELKRYDYIIAPIADNRMFQIINAFIEGEITDEQCKHCLAATNLGSQYVFLTQRAIKQVNILERCYISQNERESLKGLRSSEYKLGQDKVKLARRQYRGKGKYIDEILT